MADDFGSETISEELEQACAQEPIHIIGTVQPHGFVLVVDIESARIVQVSTGMARHWPRLVDSARLLNEPLREWVDGLGGDPAGLLRGLSRSLPMPLALQPRLFGAATVEMPGASVAGFECVGHRVGDVAVLEWQSLTDRSEEAAGDARHLVELASARLRLRSAPSLDEFYRDAVREVSRLCGFDRVMMYRFLPDWSGEVLAEEALPPLDTRFLGMRFPASDIPSQARALYSQSKIRVLADVQADPDRLLPPLLPSGQPLDQSHSVLRGFSEVHRTYLGNMGVRATMSLSIVCDGKLWGLIACHHYQPRIASNSLRVALRNICELLAEVIALRIEALTQLEHAHDTVAREQLFIEFQQAVVQEDDTHGVLTRMTPALLTAFQASALCVRIGELCFVGGETPGEASAKSVLEEVAACVARAPRTGVLQRSDLLESRESALTTLPTAAGLLVASRATRPLEICAFTRPEVVEEVEWAGAPSKLTVTQENGRVRLEPRRSFSVWKERVAGRARAWSAAEAQACERLLGILSEACAVREQRAFQQELRYSDHRERLAGVQRANLDLERRVIARTAEFEALNRKLIEEGARFAIAADAAGLGFWDFDIATDQLQWDERMFRLYGQSPTQGDGPAAVLAGSLHADDRDRWAQEFAAACSASRPYDTEFRILHPNGAIRYLRAAGRLLRDPEGRAFRILGVTFDVTERKQADEQFRLAIEAAPTGMLLMDLSGSIVMVNAQIEALFGYARADLLGSSINRLIPERLRVLHPDHRKGIFGVLNLATTGDGADTFGLRKDGGEVPLQIGLTALHTSEGDLILSSIVDLSQRLEIDRIRNDFISTVSHELRTPLTSISGSLGLLESGRMGALPEKAAGMVRIAYKNSRRLGRLINDILDVGTLEAGKLQLHRVALPLVDLLRQSVEANLSYAEKYQVRFLLDAELAHEGVFADPERVFADPDRLMQVLANLLSNAAKFSPPGSDVHIRVRNDSTMIRVEVEDSGSGIPAAFQPRIFEKFAQADSSTTRRFGGSGLGLSIARKLIEAMGGTIGFTTVEGRGSTFHFELPRADEVPAPMSDSDLAADSEADTVDRDIADPPGSAHALPRLLYLEDDDDLITVIRATLAGKAEIVTAPSIRAAEHLLRRGHFELVILDQTMPDGNGISLVHRIPSLAGYSLPIVVLSAADVPIDMHRKVAAALVKSQVSAAQVASTILSYLPRPQS